MCRKLVSFEEKTLILMEMIEEDLNLVKEVWKQFIRQKVVWKRVYCYLEKGLNGKFKNS